MEDVCTPNCPKAINILGAQVELECLKRRAGIAGTFRRTGQVRSVDHTWDDFVWCESYANILLAPFLQSISLSLSLTHTPAHFLVVVMVVVSSLTSCFIGGTPSPALW